MKLPCMCIWDLLGYFEKQINFALDQRVKP